LKVLDKRVAQKRKIFDYYQNELRNLPGIKFQPQPPDTFSNKWLTAITIDKNLSGTDREQIRIAFEKDNIDSRPLWKPMHLQPVFKSAPNYTNGVSEKLFKDGLCLPSGTNISESDLERICNIIRRFL
jgi:dTDP-4-amino-4,6-dideoxygalactose transaminase